MGKSTISTGPFSIAMFVYQRVNGKMFRSPGHFRPWRPSHPWVATTKASVGSSSSGASVNSWSSQILPCKENTISQLVSMYIYIYYDIILYYIISYYIILHYIILYYIILYYIILYYIILYYVTLCYIISYYITLYYIILCYIILYI